jgi:hypothetical protein
MILDALRALVDLLASFDRLLSSAIPLVFLGAIVGGLGWLLLQAVKALVTDKDERHAALRAARNKPFATILGLAFSLAVFWFMFAVFVGTAFDIPIWPFRR